ncbi:MAG: GntR family transcriptional regulator [Planctomycetes bacterium]|nr:GntR family transcriptional regulator [Planctomycetota bacterium]
MFFSIDPSNGVAIYEQIVRQVKFAIAEGILRPGQLLPSVRTLSRQLAINPNTIHRAFQQLQADGAVEPLRGRGLAVRSDAKRACVEARRALIADRLRSVLAEGLHAGLTSSDLRQLVRNQLARLDGHVATVASVDEEPNA